MGKPSAPPAPDYAGAASAQGAANLDAARAGAKLSNPNINSPYGTRTVTYGGGGFDEDSYNRALADWQSSRPSGDGIVGQVAMQAWQAKQPTREGFTKDGDTPTVTDKFAPDQQQIFDNQQQLQKQLGFLGIKAADLAGGTITKPLDFNQRFGTQAQGRQEVIDAMMSRYDQDAGRQKDATNSDLIARGIPSGSKAYETEMDRYGRARNDALQQATLASDQKSMDERRQAITEALAERQVPLNEISAFRTGSQIQPLQFQNYTGQNVQAAPVFGAANAQGQYGMDQYGVDTGQYNNMMTGLFSLGAAALGGKR